MKDKKEEVTLLTTQEVADRINLTRGRVIQLINQDRLKAQKYGRDFLIKEEDLANIVLTKPTGRPPKKAVFNG